MKYNPCVKSNLSLGQVPHGFLKRHDPYGFLKRHDPYGFLIYPTLGPLAFGTECGGSNIKHTPFGESHLRSNMNHTPCGEK
jgi:hypothetical protein